MVCEGSNPSPATRVGRGSPIGRGTIGIRHQAQILAPALVFTAERQVKGEVANIVGCWFNSSLPRHTWGGSLIVEHDDIMPDRCT